MTVGRAGVAGEGELGVVLGFDDEGTDRVGLGGGFVGGAEGGKRAGEIVEGVLEDALDFGGQRGTGGAEEPAEVGRRDGGQLVGEFGEASGVNWCWSEQGLELLFFAGHGGIR